MSKRKSKQGIYIGSASEAHRLVRCPGSWRIQPQEQLDTEYNQDGKLAHDLASQAITSDHESDRQEIISSLPRKLLVATRDYIEFIADLIDTCSISYVELKVDTWPMLPHAKGFIDWVGFDDDTGTLYVVDFKSGSGYEYHAQSNEQLLIYADSFIRQYSPLVGDAVNEVKMIIVQPRIKPEPDVWGLTIKEFRKEAQKLHAQLRRCDTPGAPLVSGEVQCQFCRAKAICPQLAKDALAGIKDRLGWSSIYTMGDFKAQLEDSEVLDEQALAIAVRAAPLLRTWLKGVEDHALQKLRRGKTIPGFALGKAVSQRKWVNEGEAAVYLSQKGLNANEVYTQKLISPAEAESLLGRSNVDTALWLQPPGKDKIINEDEALKNFIATGAFADTEDVK